MCAIFSRSSEMSAHGSGSVLCLWDCRSYTISEPAWLLEVQDMEKFLSNIMECGKFLTENCKEYLLNVDKGLDHIKLLVAHIITLKQVQVADIEETDTYAIDPDAKSKLVYCIRKEIEVESSSIKKFLNNLEEIHFNVVKLCDKIFNAYRSGAQSNFSLADITESNETSCSVAEKIDALDRFKKSFLNNHNGRKFTLEYSKSNGDINVLIDYWQSSVISSALQDLMFYIAQ
ncbi:uncharacterized protein TNIN_314311 [Trichonephila inaurata madagascariensis]|uniref:Uncharacterized protein n=1 Tax=Trichonephila inaurata madagascariensis TaxID=2747483 RepID=A0A8X7BSM5_9ARAC|nr:uncharacterized protein TNIN_314311 [Trichonephila inaurata madagascariensis]